MTTPNPAATSEQDRESASRLLLEIEKCLFSEDTDHRCTCIEKIMAHVASLRRELDEARRDGERLDWLEAHQAGLNFADRPYRKPHVWTQRRPIEFDDHGCEIGNHWYGRNYREAIDQAKRAGGVQTSIDAARPSKP